MQFGTKRPRERIIFYQNDKMINLSQQLRLGLRLTPQQVQYLKLLQLPNLSLEQRIKMELELNPMLELNEEQELSLDQEDRAEENDEKTEEAVEESLPKDDYTIEDYMTDDLSGFKSPERINRIMKTIHMNLPSSQLFRSPNGFSAS